MLKASTDFAKALAQVDKIFRTMPRQAIKAALNEVPKRYAPLVRKHVQDRYNITAGQFNEHVKMTPRNGGTDKVAMEYKGRKISLREGGPFGLKPKAPPTWKSGNGFRPYQMSFEIIKGKRRSISGGRYFVNKGKKSGGSHFLGKRLNNTYWQPHKYGVDYKTIKAIGIPQMIKQDDVRELIDRDVSERFQERVIYHYERLYKRA